MNSRIAYTLCSASHLAYAKTMADALVKHNPDYQVFIGLVDKIDNRFDTSYFAPHIVLTIEEMQIETLPQMSSQYTILELSCALKPYMAQYLFQQYQPKTLIYTDTDIVYYHPLTVLEQALEQEDVLVTPHFTTPLDNTHFPEEKEFLRSGLFNAGFFAMSNKTATHDFLAWWSSRLKDLCYLNLPQGLGADQNWLNYVPVYFPTAGIYRNKGANVAYWNLHERQVTVNNNVLMVNNTDPLLFFHFSGYPLHSKEVMSKHQNRYRLDAFPVLQTLFLEYADAVKRNDAERFAGMSCYYARKVQKPTGIMATINKVLKPVGVKLNKL